MDKNIPEYTKEVHLDQARKRATFAWEGKEVFDRSLQLLLSETTELEEVFRSLKQDRTIERATGKQLDIIGKIVGQPRELVDAGMIEYFAFQGVELGKPYGDTNNLAVGGVYWDMTRPLNGNVTLTDTEYRLFIRAKIFKDNSRGTPEDLTDFMRFVFGDVSSYMYREESASFIVMIIGELNTFQRTLLTYWSKRSEYESWFIPKPLGVKVETGLVPSNNYFAFLGFPKANGYGSLVCDGLGACEVIGGGSFAGLLV